MKIIKTILFTLFCFLSVSPVFATNTDIEKYRAKVTDIQEVECEESLSMQDYKCVQYEVQLLDGEKRNEVLKTGISMFNNEQELFVQNSKVYVSQSEDLEGNISWRIEGYSREVGIFILISVFVLLTLWVNGKQGIGATLGLIITVLMIYAFTIPMVLKGSSIFFVGTITVLAILLSSYLSHGFNKKTTISLVSMILGVLIVFVLGYIVLKSFHLTGIGEENSNMLYQQSSGNVNLFSLLLFSIVLGAVGVLDDVTIGQVSSMQELLRTNPYLKPNELYKKSMNIGRDHIASMINTLFIAYAGSSLSLVIVLALNNPDLGTLINLDFISEEIVRTVVASIGLILVVPLTSFFASNILTMKKVNEVKKR